MKKIILAFTFFAFGLSSINAQEIADNTLGLRFSLNDGLGAEFSYQRKLSEETRLEVDLGLRGNSNYSYFKATGLYEWVNHLEGNFNWYLGAGGGLWYFNAKNFDSSGAAIYAAGTVGIEYHFDIPLLVSLDFRPELGIGDYSGFHADFGLSARYKF